ncbi:MAG: Putative symporter YjcG, partial [uncultured Corynebacteriales bacterium]
ERPDHPRRERGHPAHPDAGPLRGLHRGDALHHAVGEPAEQDGLGLLRRRPVVLRCAERVRHRRRLHVGGVVPRDRRHHRPVRLRRLPLLDRLPGRLAGRAAARRRAAAELRPLHDGRRAGVPDAAAPGPHRRRCLHHHRVDLLPDRADGRRRLARRAAARHRQGRGVPRPVPGRREERHGRHRRRAHDHVRDRRRHARHDLGADRQGRPADDRRDADDDLRHGEVQLQPVLAAGLRGHRERQGRRLPQPGPAVRRRGLEDQGRPDQPGPGPGARHRRPAAHPDPLLHRADGQGRPPLGAVGDRHHRLVLPPHAGPRLRCRGAGRQRRHPGAEPGRQHRGPTVGGGAGRRRRLAGRGDLPGLHRLGGVRDDPGGGGRPDAGVVVLRGARRLRQRHPQGRRRRAVRGPGGPAGGDRDRCGRDRVVHLRPEPERGVPGRIGLRGRRVRKPAGDPLQPVLAEVQHAGCDLGHLRRSRGGAVPGDLLAGGLRQPDGDDQRPGLLLVPAGEPRDHLHPGRLLLRLARHRPVEGAGRRQVRRARGQVADRSRGAL